MIRLAARLWHELVTQIRQHLDEPQPEHRDDINYTMPTRYDINLDPAEPIATIPDYTTGTTPDDDDGWGVYL